MKITIEHYGVNYSVETDHEDVSFEKFIDLLESVTKAVYGNSLFDEYFKEQ